MLNRNSIFLIGFAVVFISGCATLKTESLDFVSDFSEIRYPEPERRGIYHKVKQGETVWRIAKAYDVSMNDIISTNNIPNAARIDKNQLIFIPGAYSIKEIFLDTEETKKEFIWPLKGKVIKYFQTKKAVNINKGIDIKAQEGAIVKAARSGRVVFADYLSGYNHTIILDHYDSYFTVYAKNARLLVKLGDLVLKGKEIANVGCSNALAALHFEIRKNSIEDNPLYYLP